MISRPYLFSATVCQRRDRAICSDRGHPSAETGRSQSPAKQESRLFLEVNVCWDVELGCAYHRVRRRGILVVSGRMLGAGV